MRFTINFSLTAIAFFCLCFWSLNGCNRPDSTSTPRNTERVHHSKITVTQTVFDEPAPTSHEMESPEPQEPAKEESGGNEESDGQTFWGVGETISVQSVLNKMITAYQNAKTYRDLGEIHIHWKQNGKTHERRTVYRTSFQRPNGLLLTINQTEILANGEYLCAYTPEIPGMILQKPCPKELSLLDILCDRKIYWSLTEVESNRFSYFPPPLVLMLAPEPLATFLYQGDSGTQQEITLLESQRYEEKECYRISMLKNDEETVFWIDSESFLLRKIELPRQIMKKDETNKENQEEMTVTLEFHEAEFNWVGVLEMNIPTNVTPVSSFSAPQIELLGKPWPSLRLTGLDGNDFVQNKEERTLFFFCWSIYTPNSFIFKEFELLYQHFKKQPNLLFLAVNMDSEAISNEKVRSMAQKFGISCPVLRCSDEKLMQIIPNRELFSCFLIDSKGNVQFCETLSSFHSVTQYAQTIQAVLDGKEIFQDRIQKLLRAETDFQNSARQWVKNGIFLKDVDVNPIVISEKWTAPASDPVVCKLQKMWSSEKLESPTWIQPFPTQNLIFVLENGKSVAEINLNGQVTSRHNFELPKNEFLQKITIFENESGINTYFGLIGKRFYLYDSRWNLKLVFPPLADENPGTLSDVLLDDFNEDGLPEIYAAFQNEKGFRKISLDGKEISRNTTSYNIFQIVSILNHGRKELRIIDQTGFISILDPQTLQLVQKQENLSKSLSSMNGYDFDEDGTDSIAVTAIGTNGKIKVLGITENGDELWNIDLPNYLYQRNIQKIRSFYGKTPDAILCGWLLLGADSSIFLVEPSGLLLDHFHFGKIITGYASAVFDGKPFLFFASTDGVHAVEILR